MTESAPHVRPWNEPSRATIPALPEDLRAYFSAASIASRAGVAEERLRAAEALGQPLGELRHRLGPVEVRDVPQPVELRVGCCERCGVSVPEADDGDPREEVQVTAAFRVDEPGAVAGDDRHVLAGVGRQDGL